MSRLRDLDRLRALAEVRQVKALAALATIQAEALVLRQRHDALTRSGQAAREAAQGDVTLGVVAQRFARWTEAQQATVSAEMALVAARREPAAQGAVQAVGRQDVLSGLLQAEAQALRRRRDSGLMEQTLAPRLMAAQGRPEAEGG